MDQLLEQQQKAENRIQEIVGGKTLGFAVIFNRPSFRRQIMSQA